MHTKTEQPTEINAAGHHPERRGEHGGFTGELGSALVEFARRLANFGLGEAESPILGEFIDRRRRPRLQA